MSHEVNNSDVLFPFLAKLQKIDILVHSDDHRTR